LAERDPAGGGTRSIVPSVSSIRAVISTSISTRKHSFRSLRPRVPTAPKVVLKRLAKDARHWIALADGVPGQGRRLFELVAKNDLEGIVAKRLVDPYAPGRTVL
jgi:ATP-dependent DNA ligase